MLGPNKIVDGISVRSPTFTENFFKFLRGKTLGLYNCLEDASLGVSRKYYSTEKLVTSSLANLRSKNEDLLPNIVYITIATLTGAVIARHKNFFLRTSLPIIFGLTAFNYTLPQTFTNSTKFAYYLEKRNLPAVTSAQDSVVNGVENLIQNIENKSKDVQDSLNSSIDSSKKYIASVSGLNLDEEVTTRKGN
ncbi:MICOS complex subunit MIC26/MIC27 ASCRUDRAFT_73349 [Ascoidea rubescens DSM 1968]|uniref:MICOS complex subunit n=1 Tax=Ascoidea rubescens DSM 1968 TaxID=1344418 RepID=A0A1D2VPI4_9ASCO|nr:hypothetical protein ASCRUDRAFT_73349 [Ascoidea rubescens DSM 1968]ODV63509.1 hypothetical protein ASCRUDRAFT_73349 [Ascoidea rubescens DSM 1968]